MNKEGRWILLQEDQLRLVSVGFGRLLPALALSHEPDCADQATKAPTRVCGIMAKRTGEAAPLQGGQKCQIGQNEPRCRGTHHACTFSLSAQSAYSPFRLKILLYFSCCLQGCLFLRSLRLCPFSAFEKTNPSQKPPVGKNRGRGATRHRAVLAKRTQGGSPVGILAKRSQGAARSRLWPNEPKGHPVAISARRTRAADQSAPSQNEPRATQRFASPVPRFELNEMTPMSLVTPSS